MGYREPPNPGECWDCRMDDLPLTQSRGCRPGVLRCFWCTELWNLRGLLGLPDPGRPVRR